MRGGGISKQSRTSKREGHLRTQKRTRVTVSDPILGLVIRVGLPLTLTD